MNEQSTNPDQLAGIQDTSHRIQQQRAPEVPALIAGIDGQSPEQDDGYRLIGCQAAYESRGCCAGHDRPGRECVIASDIRICLGRNEHARTTAAMALKGKLAQPFIERRHPAPEALGAVPRLKRNGLLKAHELVVEHAG